jgi:hypothetical protein
LTGHGSPSVLDSHTPPYQPTAGLDKRKGSQLIDNLINMDISAHGEPAALQDARKQRYFLPHSDDYAASQPKSVGLYNPDADHDTISVTDLHPDIFLDTRTTPAILGAKMIETQRREIPTPSWEPDIVALPTVSDSDSVTRVSRQLTIESSALLSKSTLERAADLTVIDAQGQEIPFKELYRVQPGLSRRVMIIFIRHFFCGVSLPIVLSFDVPANNPFLH